MVPRWGKKSPNGFCNFLVTSLTLPSWVSQGLSYVSRDQPCETRLLARLESLMVSWEKFAEVVRTRRVSGERHVLYLTSYVRTEQVWSRMSRETFSRRSQRHHHRRIHPRRRNHRHRAVDCHRHCRCPRVAAATAAIVSSAATFS